MPPMCGAPRYSMYSLAPGGIIAYPACIPGGYAPGWGPPPRASGYGNRCRLALRGSAPCTYAPSGPDTWGGRREGGGGERDFGERLVFELERMSE